MRKPTSINFEVIPLQQLKQYIIAPVSMSDMINIIVEFMLLNPSVLHDMVRRKIDEINRTLETIPNNA